MATIQLDAGRKQKIRPGDLLGALTGDAGLAGASVGKIDVFDTCTFVAIERAALRQALNHLANGRVKGRTIKARKVS
jgi:ATP-independent RNA helicase DbpA